MMLKVLHLILIDTPGNKANMAISFKVEALRALNRISSKVAQVMLIYKRHLGLRLLLLSTITNRLPPIKTIPSNCRCNIRSSRRPRILLSNHPIKNKMIPLRIYHW
jgi:hypothetical protein